MVTIALIAAIVALAATAGLVVWHFRRDAKSRVGGKPERHGFSGGTMLVLGGSKFGHRDWGLPHPEPGRYRRNLPKFRDFKQLDRPSVRPGDIDFWAAKRGVQSRSDALRLLVGMAVSAKQGQK